MLKSTTDGSTMTSTAALSARSERAAEANPPRAWANVEFGVA